MTTKERQKTHNGLSKIPSNIKNVSPKHEDFKREVLTQQSKAQKNFNNNLKKNK